VTVSKRSDYLFGFERDSSDLVGDRDGAVREGLIEGVGVDAQQDGRQPTLLWILRAGSAADAVVVKAASVGVPVVGMGLELGVIEAEQHLDSAALSVRLKVHVAEVEDGRDRAPQHVLKRSRDSEKLETCLIGCEKAPNPDSELCECDQTLVRVKFSSSSTPGMVVQLL
jgi:hypothetical protein